MCDISCSKPDCDVALTKDLSDTSVYMCNARSRSFIFCSSWNEVKFREGRVIASTERSNKIGTVVERSKQACRLFVLSAP